MPFNTIPPNIRVNFCLTHCVAVAVYMWFLKLQRLMVDYMTQMMQDEIPKELVEKFFMSHIP